MTRSSSKGTCCYCSGIYAKSAMSRHLKACPARKEEIEECTVVGQTARQSNLIIHLQVEGQYLPQYWLHLEIEGRATLKDLDSFLRQFWLECCGHLSNFYIRGESFASEVSLPGEEGMDIALERALSPKEKFEYIYDFGASTELLLKVISVRRGSMDGESVNYSPMNWRACASPALEVCSSAKSRATIGRLTSGLQGPNMFPCGGLHQIIASNAKLISYGIAAQ